jgi:serine protease Do
VIEAIGPETTDSMAAARAIAGRAAIGEHAIVVRINRNGGVSYRRLAARS